MDEPTKIFGPDLENILNRAGFYKFREWEDLTDDEIWEVFKKHDSMLYKEFARAIEAKLREKNT